LAIRVLILVFALAALLLSGLPALLTHLPALAFLLSGLIAMLTRRSTLPELPALLLVFFHIVCHKIPPSNAQRGTLNWLIN
jgi:hypothetical protein